MGKQSTLLLPTRWVAAPSYPLAPQDELDAVFPDKRGGFKDAFLITTAQQAAMDLVAVGPEVDAEKDALLERVRAVVLLPVM